MRHCLFIEFEIEELYNSRDDWKCPDLEWIELEADGQRWMMAECHRPAKKRSKYFDSPRRKMYICHWSCRKRGNGGVRGFIGEVGKRIGKWRDELINDELERMETRQSQLSIGSLVITL